MPLNRLWRLLAAPGLLLAAAAQAQTSPPTPPTNAAAPVPARAASAPARAASAPAGAASAPARNAPAAANSSTQSIEIVGNRSGDVEQRRQATAAKIVVGREEIEKFGDATVGEVLRRLPGVTTPGAPGRGGPPRMRGLGNGFTQLLIDGQRVPPGFSLESLTPEQIERIEILRAPTAETGARAIAGTINIITREGFKRRLNDVRIGFGVENGKLTPGLNWTHNDSVGDFVYNLSGALFAPRRESTSSTHTTLARLDDGSLLEERVGHSTSAEKRTGLNFTSRLQWKLNEAGDMLVLMPSVFHAQGYSASVFTLDQLLAQPVCGTGEVDRCTPDYYKNGNSRTDSDFTNARLGLQWRQRLGPVRLETNAHGAAFRSDSSTRRFEFGARSGDHVLQDDSRSREKSVHLTLKASGLAGGSEEGGGEHSLVGGAEVDASRRTETRTSLDNGVDQLADFSDNVQASALRLAAYLQDEWRLTPNWAAHAGLRWEGITTRGDTAQGERPTNRSSVWTPLVHAVWKPDPKGRDQVRISLTRSYRSPALATLIARPSISRLRPVTPVDQPNDERTPDSAGNPELKPELATGIDLALERYLEGGGILSANLFHRNISNLMRSRVELEDSVPWSSFPRYVRRTRNIGDASTSGIELEAKFRLDQMLEGAAPVELRTNLALYTSRVKSVPGPDNRLDQQAKGTANLGADYRLRSLPLTLGGNLNWVPGYTTRLDVDQTTTVVTKRVLDLYALWTFSPAVGLRVLASNLLRRDYATTSVNDIGTAPDLQRLTSVSSGPSYVNWQLRLELKL